MHLSEYEQELCFPFFFVIAAKSLLCFQTKHRTVPSFSILSHVVGLLAISDVEHVQVQLEAS